LRTVDAIPFDSFLQCSAVAVEALVDWSDPFREKPNRATLAQRPGRTPVYGAYGANILTSRMMWLIKNITNNLFRQ
jgi:hypothetical protein